MLRHNATFLPTFALVLAALLVCDFSAQSAEKSHTNKKKVPRFPSLSKGAAEG